MLIPNPMRVWPLLLCAGLAGCALVPQRDATPAESLASRLVLRAQRVTVRSGGELTLRNAGPSPFFITSPYSCSVLLLLYDAEHRPLQVNFMATRYCDPAKAGPLRLGAGDSIAYALSKPGYDEAQLHKARYYEVVYEGIISPKPWEVKTWQARRRPHHTLKVIGTIQ